MIGRLGWGKVIPLNFQKPSLIILDRDGVINEDSTNYVKSPEEWHPIPGSLEAVIELKKNGYLIAVATNQSGVARGLFSEVILAKIHQKMTGLLKLMVPDFDFDVILSCVHDPDAGCECRKPKPGMLLEIAKVLNIEPQAANIWFVGDSYRDCQAAWAANCQSVVVRTGHGASTLQDLDSHSSSDSVMVFDDLKQMAAYLCSH